ncbi:MAG: hypothetical protein IJU76_14220 [Desulfovibrionaceae bacterium]|nr:hypothetical protein [Desulfovibrionaceae bacterium]
MSDQKELLERFKEYADKAAACTKSLENAQDTVTSAVTTVTEEVAALKEKITTAIDEAIEEKIDDGSADFTPATNETAGKAGMVPAPTVQDKGKFLKGNGIWAAITSEDIDGGAKTIACADVLPAVAPDDLSECGLLIVGRMSTGSTGSRQ